MTSRKKSQRCADESVVYTGGECFSDGSILELTRLPNGALNFLVWNGESTKRVRRFVRDGETFVPLSVGPVLLRSLRLPSNAAEYGSTRELFTEICNFIFRVTQLGDVAVRSFAFFVFAAWLIDELPIAPFLWVVTPPMTTAEPIKNLMSLLCRRTITVCDISTTGFGALPIGLQPTLITEILKPTGRVLNLLRASGRRGALIAARGKLIDTYCAKIVFAPEPLRDPASAGFPLELVLPPTRECVPSLSSEEIEQTAAELQAKLLRYRLVNRTKVRKPDLGARQLTGPMQEIAYSLAAAIVGDDELQAQILPLLKPRDSEIRVEQASLLPAIVLEGLLARCHSTTGTRFSVHDLTTDVNTIRFCRGESLEVSPETIGWALRGLSLHTDFIPRGRRGLVLTSDVRNRIHDLAAAYEVRTLRALPAKIDCPICAALSKRMG